MAARNRTRVPTGWVLLASLLMLMAACLNFCFGLAAVVNDQVVVVGGHGAVIADITTWGWVNLILGVILAGTGIGLMVAAGWARWVGLVFVVLNAVAQVGVFTYAPLWAFMVILLDVFIIWSLTARWERAGLRE